jgi:hypothetical protein
MSEERSSERAPQADGAPHVEQETVVRPTTSRPLASMSPKFSASSVETQAEIAREPPLDRSVVCLLVAIVVAVLLGIALLFR